MKKVLIFEDNKHFRETLRILVSGAPGFECAGAFANCRHMHDLLREAHCDIVLMDIAMPGISGIAATQEIKSRFPDIQVLIQTVFSDDDYIFQAIKAGANGYILKTTSPAGYLEALSDVAAGGSPMTPGIARRVMELFRNAIAPRQAEPGDYQLTAREKEILQLLVDGKSYKMIAADLSVALDTVKSHMTSIYQKLHVHSGTEAVAKAIRNRII